MPIQCYENASNSSSWSKLVKHQYTVEGKSQGDYCINFKSIVTPALS